MFRRRREPRSIDDELDWTEDENHSEDSASSCSSGSDLRSDDGSEDSSSYDEDSNVSSDSSPEPPERSFWQDEGLSAGDVSSIRRRTAGRSSPSSDSGIDVNSWDETNSSTIRSHRTMQRRHRHSKLWHGLRLYHKRCPRLWNRRTAVVVIVCFVVWLFVRSTHSRSSSGWMDTDDPFESAPSVKELTRQQLEQLRKERRKEARKALGAAAGDVVRDTVGGISNIVRAKPKQKHKGGVTVEALPQGCINTDWQTMAFPNCNDIHEIDLRESLHLKKRGPKLPDLGAGDKSEAHITENEAATARKIGYVGSGLWRSVWKVDPRGEASGQVDSDGAFEAPAVLKIMKGEHEFDARNLDRHRRDALVMERLTSSPNVVSIYGYCGNTVLTEYVGKDLSQIIYKDAEVDKEGSAATGTNQKHTRKTATGRLHLALEVARGLAAMHDIPGGPIIHADIQAKQFLVDPLVGVKVNDFNRCRFMPKSIKTGKPCPIKIPSAPGAARSPEEYERMRLTEKIDVYSTANVLYGILTGLKPWPSYTANTVKKRVMGGKKPIIDQKYLVSGTSDAALASLIQRAYELDPRNRISASELLRELEIIAAREANTD